MGLVYATSLINRLSALSVHDLPSPRFRLRHAPQREKPTSFLSISWLTNLLQNQAIGKSGIINFSNLRKTNSLKRQ